jgi:hypothetical protein
VKSAFGFRAIGRRDDSLSAWARSAHAKVENDRSSQIPRSVIVGADPTTAARAPPTIVVPVAAINPVVAINADTTPASTATTATAATSTVAARTAAATASAAATATATGGLGRRASRHRDETRHANDAETINSDQGRRRQPARQELAASSTRIHCHFCTPLCPA